MKITTQFLCCGPKKQREKNRIKECEHYWAYRAWTQGIGSSQHCYWYHCSRRGSERNSTCVVSHRPGGAKRRFCCRWTVCAQLQAVDWTQAHSIAHNCEVGSVEGSARVGRYDNALSAISPLTFRGFRSPKLQCEQATPLRHTQWLVYRRSGIDGWLHKYEEGERSEERRSLYIYIYIYIIYIYIIRDLLYGIREFKWDDCIPMHSLGFRTKIDRLKYTTNSVIFNS